MTAQVFEEITKNFPDYDQSTLPVIPEGYDVRAWYNDACPHFISMDARLDIWMDYADKALREHDCEDLKRFAVYPVQDDESFAEDMPIFESDDWAEVLAFIQMKAWEVDGVVEYANGLRAEVRAVSGDLAVLEQLPDGRVDGLLFFVAQGSPAEFSFLNDEEGFLSSVEAMACLETHAASTAQ